MKKLIYLSSLVLFAGLTACDNYEEPNPPAQSNPEEPVFKTENVEFFVDEATKAQPVNLEEYNNDDKNLPLSVVVAPDVPAGYALKAVMEISADDTFTNTFDVATVMEDGIEAGSYNLSVAPDALDGVYVANITKYPDAATIYYRYRLYVVSGKTEARVGGPDVYYEPGEMNILPLPKTYVIEEAYYLVGTVSDGTVAKAVKFAHSDINQYDDPVFTVDVDITEAQAAAGWEWKVIPASTFAAGNFVEGADAQFGPAVASNLRGSLVGGNAQYGKVKNIGSFVLTIDLEAKTYVFSVAPENLWIPGEANGWFIKGMAQALFTEDKVHFNGYAYINGEFLITTRPDMKGVVFGAGEHGLSDSDDALVLTVKTPGLYWMNIDLNNLSYSATHIETIGIIGGFNGWSASAAMTPSDDFLTWTINDVKFNAGDEWKFRANDGWDINLGGEYANLTQGGGNLKIEETGNYDIVLHLDVLPYSCEVTKK